MPRLTEATGLSRASLRLRARPSRLRASVTCRDASSTARACVMVCPPSSRRAVWTTARESERATGAGRAGCGQDARARRDREARDQRTDVLRLGAEARRDGRCRGQEAPDARERKCAAEEGALPGDAEQGRPRRRAQGRHATRPSEATPTDRATRPLQSRRSQATASRAAPWLDRGLGRVPGPHPHRCYIHERWCADSSSLRPLPS